MRILTSLNSYQRDSSKPLILGLGNFDGVHLGHQSLIRYVVAQAKKKNGLSALLTFAEHPQEILHPGQQPKLLTSMLHRLWLFSEMGVDLVFVLHFTEKFSQVSARQFVEMNLVHQLGVSEVCLGYNAHFGRGREGDGIMMKKLSQEFGFDFREMDSVRVDGEVVSSTVIRNSISEGELRKAASLLERPFSVVAKVIKGDGRGKELGFPTANLDIAGLLLPPFGVYPVLAREVVFPELSAESSTNFNVTYSNKWSYGVLNYGKRPTFGQDGALAAETHLLDFKGDMYGKHLQILFYPRLRSEKQFASAEELKAQIILDIEDAKKALIEAKVTQK